MVKTGLSVGFVILLKVGFPPFFNNFNILAQKVQNYQSGRFGDLWQKDKSDHSGNLRGMPTLLTRSGPEKAVLGVFCRVADFRDFADWRIPRVHESVPRMHTV